MGPTVKSTLPYVTANVTGSGWYDHEFGGKVSCFYLPLHFVRILLTI